MRADHVQSAVAFLQEPQVSSATLDKKVEFLESKGLTKDEIEEALRRVNESGQASGTVDTARSSVSTVPPAPEYVPPRPSYMLQQPPPVPQRDWKDYFVMATVSVGVAYGLYEVAKRYVLPAIMPPTPPALEADKEALEAEFQRTEALVQQLQTDVAELRAQEEARSEDFNKIMTEARDVVDAIRLQAEERKQESKLALSHVEALREAIPRSLKQHGETQARAITELQEELKSLKQLSARRADSPAGKPSILPASAVPSSLPGFPRKQREKTPSVTPPSEASDAKAGADKPAPSAGDQKPREDGTQFVPTPGAASADAPNPQIPEWQRAAQASN